MEAGRRKVNQSDWVFVDCEAAGICEECAIEFNLHFHSLLSSTGRANDGRLARNDGAKWASGTVSEVSQDRAGQGAVQEKRASSSRAASARKGKTQMRGPAGSLPEAAVQASQMMAAV